MGKLTLLLVGAAILGGSLLTFSTRQFAGGTEKRYRSGQADVLSRQIAESGHSLVLASIITDAGFSAPTFTHEEYEGGVYRVAYDPASTADRATFTVAADYAGATHVIKSTYEWDPMDYPGPIWLDVPYVSASVASGASVDGGAQGLEVQFDRRKHDELGLGSIVPLGTMEAGLTTAFAPTASTYEAGRAANSWPALLEDVNVDNAEGLYQAALSTPPETSIAGPHTVTGSERNLGAPGEVTHVAGNLTVSASGAFTGEGALVIDGLLTVEASGVFEWTGIVIVKSEQQFTPVRLQGNVDITGGLVVVQNAFPPGGHLDVTVWRDMASGLGTTNIKGEQALAPWAASEPWKQHKHRFDLDLGTKRVAFLEGGSAVAAQETWTQFEDTISRLGSEEVYLEIVNPGQHGYSNFVLDLASESDPFGGTVRGGFGAFARDTNPHQTKPFQANDLETLVVDVKSLQALKDRFDGEDGCPATIQWPRCLSYEWSRGDVMRLRLRKASTNQIVYETGFYWHMLEFEWTEYQTRVAAWQAQIQSGALFGTRLELGPDVDIQYDLAPVMELVERLNFDGHETVHVGSETSHRSLDQNIALASVSSTGQVTLCHDPMGAKQNMAVPNADVLDHVSHKDYLGRCSTITPDGIPPAPANPLAMTGGDPTRVVCHTGAPTTVLATSIGIHLLHGDTVGGCPDTPATGLDNIVVCHGTQSVAVSISEYSNHIDHGDTYGSCP